MSKAQYSPSEFIASPSWDLNRFLSADRKREIDRTAKKEERAEIVFSLFDYIEENNICSFSKFLRIVSSSLPQYKAIVLEKHTIFRDFIKDRFDYNSYFNEVELKFQNRVKELDSLYAVRFEDFQREMEEKVAFRESQIADLECYIAKITKGTAQIEELQEIKDAWARDMALIAEFDAVGVDDSKDVL